MSVVDRIGAASFDLADPIFMLYACVALILVCVLLDAPAIASTLRVLRRKRRLSRSFRGARNLLRDSL